MEPMLTPLDKLAIAFDLVGADAPQQQERGRDMDRMEVERVEPTAGLVSYRDSGCRSGGSRVT